MATQSGDSSKILFTPEPHEAGYYDALFATADIHRGGAIGGADAVQFFSRSKLPVDVLKSVWTLADQPPSNSLDKQKFAAAVRLIQLIQNNVKGQGTNLAAPPGVVLRPVHFDGVSGVSVPLPPPAPQQQQQQQQAPPQPQPPSPQRQQHPPRAPTPQSRPPSALSGSTALTPQDPYTLTPTEQARYDDIFPQYANPDGFCYGKEAVALFSKSGVPQQQLAAIWSLVDQPVDNRLDKLEFAIAMHLIVCVSKKNLPLPPSLPLSLKQLKSQQAAAMPPQQQQQQPPSPQFQPAVPQQPPSPQSMQQPRMPSPLSMQQQPGMPSPQSMQQPGMPSPQSMQQQPGMPSPPNLQQPGIPSPQGIQQQQQQQQQQQGIPSPQRSASPMVPPIQAGGPPPLPTFQVSGVPQSGSASVMSGGGGSMTGPPPLQPVGGGTLSISDAFEGLDGASATDASSYKVTAVQPTRSFDAGSFQQPPAAATAPTVPSPVVVESSHHHEPTTKELAQQYDMGGARDELEKLKDTLQKLQAENVSLKAQLGNMTDEEKDIQRELSAAVSEISKLASDLTSVRAQVLASKSRLLEAAAELKALEEKKGVITDLIAEATSTKNAIDEATAGIDQSLEAMKLQAPAPAPAANFDEGDLFGFGAAPASLPGSGRVPDEAFGSAALPGSGPVPAPLPGSGPVPEPAPEPEPAAAPAPLPTPVQRAPSTDSADNNMYGMGHQRNNTFGGFGDGSVMGGTSNPASFANAPSGGDGAYEPPKSVMSNEEIDELKSRSREADNVARDAEETRRQLVAQADELRRVADEAEKKSRDHIKATSGKKKGFMGRGKKKEAKDGEKLAGDAKTKKEAFLQAQSQVNDASAVAQATKAEAESLRKKAEDAEMSAAAAASMESSKQEHSKSNGYGASTSYGLPHAGDSYGVPPPSGSDSYGLKPPAESPYSMGAPPTDEQSYNPSVMGSGGGFSIPTPSGDPYDNPFSS